MTDDWLTRWREEYEPELAKHDARMDAVRDIVSERPLYYDREGNAITMSWWTWLRADWTYHRIAETTLADGNVRVSTVWLGLDHRYYPADAPPLIFETMVFGMPEESEYGVFHRELGIQWRYETEEQASIGHGKAVEQVLAAIAAGLIPEAEPIHPELD